MTTVGTTQTFAYALSGVDPMCASGAGSAANSCGLHIHSGMTCTDNALGHYYTGSVTTDPWTSVAYTSTADGKTTGSVVVDTGATQAEVVGRAFIVHAYDGSRIACALLQPVPSPAPTAPEPEITRDIHYRLGDVAMIAGLVGAGIIVGVTVALLGVMCCRSKRKTPPPATTAAVEINNTYP